MRKHSRYRQRPVISDPLSLLRPAPKAMRDALMLNFYTALEALSRGEHPGPDEWRSLSDAINSVETLATCAKPKLVPAEVMPLVNAAIEAMVQAANRYKAGQRMGVSGPGLQALRDVVAVYEQCLTNLTEREMALAQQETQRRVNEILRARQPNEETVCMV
jgi:hypothetical protein